MSDSSKIALNPIQQEAIEHSIDSPLKVIAGAGTGKTMVLTHRFVHILKRHPDIAPQNILALTFTNKAAEEMKERIIKLAKGEGIIPSQALEKLEQKVLQAFEKSLSKRGTRGRNAPRGTSVPRDAAFAPQLWVGTFHSFCGRILRENAFEAGLDPDFTILSEADSRQIHHRIVEDLVSLRLNTDEFRPDEYNYVRFENPEFLYSGLLTFISKLKDQLVSPENFRKSAIEGTLTYYNKLDALFDEAMNSPNIVLQTKKALKRRHEENVPFEYGYEAEMIEIVYHIYRAYQDYLSRNDMLDFGDLIFKAYAMLYEIKRLRQRYQQQFKYILVDEFQDTNEAQFKLLRLLARDERLSNVTVVGDDKQAIYGWRNARVENVDDFTADDWGGRSLNVSQNYRSYGEILDVAHFSIVQDEKFMRQSDKIKLEPAKLGAANKPIVIMYEAEAREQEAAFVAHEIVKLLKTGVELDDIVILMRGLRSVRAYEDALRKAHIPYRTTGGTGFYDRQEIRDILAYLMVLDDPFDTKAIVRILKRPPIRLNDLSLYYLSRQKSDEVQLFDALKQADALLKDPEAVRRINRFLRLVEEMWEVMDEGSIFYLTSQLLERSGYLKYIHSMPADERDRSLANVRKLLRMASEFERKHAFGDLRDFVQYVRFSMEQLVVEAEAGSESDIKAIQIMTIHQAKGLEFDVVFIVNARKPSFPTRSRHPMFAFDDTDGLIINTDRDGDKFFKFSPYDLKKNSHLYQKYGITDYSRKFESDHLREERRILYVAITRAMRLLYLSCPRVLNEDAGSDFFQEIQDGFADEGIICEFRKSIEEDVDNEPELPLWIIKGEPAFGNIEEAVEYGKRLTDLISSRHR